LRRLPFHPDPPLFLISFSLILAKNNAATYGRCGVTNSIFGCQSSTNKII
jgi:hypothetical protein